MSVPPPERFSSPCLLCYPWWGSLQALRVVLVLLVAGRTFDTLGRAGPVVTTTLSILANGTGVATAVAVASASRLRGSAGAGAGAGASAGVCAGSGGKGAANGTELDVGEDNRGIAVLGLDLDGIARGGSTRASLGTNLGRVNGVGRVEPEHV